MKNLLIFACIGFVAQFIDGTLGMSYGLTSTTLLLSFGLAPAVVSASVHIAEIVTTAVSGVSHFRFGNIDKYIVKTLIIPGSIGAFVGATLLSSLSGHLIKPYIAGFLLILGFYVLFRYLFDKRRLLPKRKNSPKRMIRPKKRFLYPLGLLAGFLDAIGGGGWGEVNTPVLMTRTGLKPRKVIGSVDTSEFFIALSATAGFLISLGFSEIGWTLVIALSLAGFVAAPIAAWLVKVMPSQTLGVLAGGIIIVTNARTLLHSTTTLPSTWHGAVYSSLLTLWIFSIIFILWMKKVKNSQKK